jgi:phosphoribosylaminoimidazole-succinocarboxamide synthase
MSDYAAIREVVIPELPHYYRGKVRENYDLADGRRIIIATDRLSAFDRAIACIPLKGQVLTQMARFWFECTADICPNHALAYPDANVVVGQKLEILPVEMVVRGYLAGTTATSVLTMYKQGARDIYGVHFPDGLRDNEVLPRAILTPTSKAFDGGHDEPLSPKEIVEKGILTTRQWDTIAHYALALFARGQAMARERGLILVDTKYEFGTDADGRIVLADEIHTPDSSRYWFAASYPERFEKGEKPESFDKDFVRNWVAARCDPYKDAIPEIPETLIDQTTQVYVRAYETVTGGAFEPPSRGEDPVERIRKALTQYF